MPNENEQPVALATAQPTASERFFRKAVFTLERKILMNAQLSKLLEKKKAAGILNGQDALAFLRHVRAVGDASGKWTLRDFDELTRWQFGLPTRTQFQIVAGPVGAHAPKRVEISPERRTLLRRKYGTFAERQAARKAKEAARQASLRLKKMA
jgi:hypothetical protein